MGFLCPWDFPVHGISQARILEWVATSFSRRSSWPRDWTRVSHIVGRRFTVWATRDRGTWWATVHGVTTERLHFTHQLKWGFPDGSVVKNRPADTGDEGSTLGLGQSLEKEMATHSSILIWEVPRTEEPGGLHSRGSQRVKKHLSK